MSYPWVSPHNLTDRINTMKNQVILGDCLEVMRTMEENSVDLTVTSPPYDNLRTYNGYTFDFEGIAKELFRVTKDGGVVVWVVGDATIKGSETGTSFKQALYFKEIGMNLHDTMIYHKPNAMPLTHNRYDPCFEYMFVFSKGTPKTFNPIKEKTLHSGKINKRELEVKMVGIKGHQSRCRDEHTVVGNSKYIKNLWSYMVGVEKDKKTNKHPAIFPEKLAEDHILSWSNEGDTVLDPMAGSGTTLKMAKKNNRSYIGIEISQDYIDIINERLSTPISLD
jgi:DNA modification methylase